MRTIDEIAEEWVQKNGVGTLPWEAVEIAKCVAIEVIDHILSHPEMIYSDEPGDVALYDYEAFDKLKKLIK